MHKACSTHWRIEKYIHHFSRKLKQRLEDLIIDGMLLLNGSS
jgi:hypothetical protein